ncbi:hypothetical protein B9Z55_011774 [Caenorhabditis nigoni]|uniref:Uncharacterized protein n=1 Tax=Caenorhabditis nigoni TaxID=1611254 RepID=A0A2G5ULM4_9PELO|nr:hypothetical protein B9Z55_011774 [Caenorhabditis nigoni]
MVLTLKSLEFMNGVEAFRIEENEEISGGKVAEKESVSVETDAGMAMENASIRRLGHVHHLPVFRGFPGSFSDSGALSIAIPSDQCAEKGEKFADFRGGRF